MSTEIKESQQLTAQQEQVIMLMLAGKTQVAAAEEVGIAAETISRWKSGDPVFVAHYNRTRRDLWEAHHHRLTDLRGQAVDTVAGLMDSENEPTRLKAALSVLAMADGKPTGGTDPEAVEHDWEQAAKHALLFDF